MAQIQMNEVPMSLLESMAQRNATVAENNRIAMEEDKAYRESMKLAYAENASARSTEGMANPPPMGMGYTEKNNIKNAYSGYADSRGVQERVGYPSNEEMGIMRSMSQVPKAGEIAGGALGKPYASNEEMSIMRSMSQVPKAGVMPTNEEIAFMNVMNGVPQAGSNPPPPKVDGEVPPTEEMYVFTSPEGGGPQLMTAKELESVPMSLRLNQGSVRDATSEEINMWRDENGVPQAGSNPPPPKVDGEVPPTEEMYVFTSPEGGGPQLMTAKELESVPMSLRLNQGSVRDATSEEINMWRDENQPVIRGRGMPATAPPVTTPPEPFRPGAGEVPNMGDIPNREQRDLRVNPEVERYNAEQASSRRSSNIDKLRTKIDSLPAGGGAWLSANRQLNELIEEDKELSLEEAANEQFLQTVDAERAVTESRLDERDRQEKLTNIERMLEETTDPDQIERLNRDKAELEHPQALTPEEIRQMEAEDIESAELAARTGDKVIEESANPDNTDIPEAAGPQVEQVANTDPKGWRRAIDWFADLMGVEGNDILRMGMYYAGSRLAGSSHVGAMNWAFGAAMSTVEGRNKTMNDLRDSGKWTPVSMGLFEKSRDTADLVAIADPDPKTWNRTVPHYFVENGVTKQAFEVSDSTGTYFSTLDGEVIDPSRTSELTPEEARVESRNASTKETPDIIKRALASFEKDNEGITDRLSVNIGEIADVVHDRLSLSGEPFDLATYTSIVESAAKAAARDRKNNPDSIIKYLDEAIIIHKDSDWTQAMLNSDGEFPEGEDWDYVSGRAIAQARAADVASGGTGSLSGHPRSYYIERYMEYAVSEWNGMIDPNSEHYNPEERMALEKNAENSGGEDGTPFMMWLKRQK